MDPEVGTFRGRFKSGLFIHCPPHLKGLLKDELSGAISSEKKDVLFSSAERGVERISFGGAFSRTETKTFLNLGKCRRKSNFQHKPRVHPEVHPQVHPQVHPLAGGRRPSRRSGKNLEFNYKARQTTRRRVQITYGCREYTQRQIYVELKDELIDVLRGERRAEEGPANLFTHRPQHALHRRVSLSKAADRGEGEEFAVRDLAGALVDVAYAAALEESKSQSSPRRDGRTRTTIVPPFHGVTADPNQCAAPLALAVFPLTAGHALGVAALEGDLFEQGGAGDAVPAEIADVGIEDAGDEVDVPLALVRVRLGLAVGDERGDSGAVQRALEETTLERRGKRENGGGYGGRRWRWENDVGGGQAPPSRENSQKVEEEPREWDRAQKRDGEAREVTAKHWKEDRQRERITSRVDSKENEIEAEDGTNQRRRSWSQGACSLVWGSALPPAGGSDNSEGVGAAGAISAVRAAAASSGSIVSGPTTFESPPPPPWQDLAAKAREDAIAAQRWRRARTPSALSGTRDTPTILGDRESEYGEESRDVQAVAGEGRREGRGHGFPEDALWDGPTRCSVSTTQRAGATRTRSLSIHTRQSSMARSVLDPDAAGGTERVGRGDKGAGAGGRRRSGEQGAEEGDAGT
ncbi:hypothetical protein B0H11DRAFT_1942139 [Mycena galericulata]|nr:hypothetical protein B0H11DRAFT_1942139 [Mycena galericulata]